MTAKLIAPVVLLLTSGLLLAQTPSVDKRKATPQVCRLILANPSGFNPFQFIPRDVNLTRLNRFPKVSYVVNEDGSVSDVKILKGTGSPEVDAGLVKSVQTWKYKPQPGCAFEMSSGLIIDIGSQRSK